MRLLTLFILSTVATNSFAKADKPNVIVIMADDLGYHDLGFQGAEVIKTPHLDRLAKGGVIFTDAHVSASVCSPSRAGFMTGRYQQRFGHEANSPNGTQGMATSEYTIGQAFQSLGYKTYMVGKWHLGSADEMSPTKRGFSEFWGLRSGSRKYFYTEGKEKFGKKQSIEHNDEHVKFDGHLTDRMTDAAIGMIEADRQTPFFLFLSYTAPHTPLQATPEDLAKADGNPYRALVQNMDDNIGRLVATLDENKLRVNTMIWFLSDNGGISAGASNYPLNGKKGVKFEGGQRVPFIVNWPSKIKGGQRFSGMTSSLDIFPTSFKVAGGIKTRNRLDGVDLMPFLTGEKPESPHEVLYWRKLEQAAVRIGPWKLIRAEGLSPMLYNIEDDLSELSDLAEAHPEKVQELNETLSKWEAKETVAPLWKEGPMWTKVRKQGNIKWRDAEKVYRTLGTPARVR